MSTRSRQSINKIGAIVEGPVGNRPFYEYRSQQDANRTSGVSELLQPLMTKVNEEVVFYFRNFQLTEDGQVGVDGRRVVNLVELVPNNVLEAVQSHHRIMAGNTAQEQRGKHKSAKRNLALVRNKMQIFAKLSPYAMWSFFVYLTRPKGNNILIRRKLACGYDQMRRSRKNINLQID